ncbi:Uncharacterized protein Rs2_29847 [Raphanus sativus]|nr:Uncharacterized protein Rs2_29847 [Raphanus sativus]
MEATTWEYNSYLQDHQNAVSNVTQRLRYGDPDDVEWNLGKKHVFRQTSTTTEDGEGSVFLMKLELSYKRCLKGEETSLLAVYIKRGIDISRWSGEPRRRLGI